MFFCFKAICKQVLPTACVIFISLATFAQVPKKNEAPIKFDDIRDNSWAGDFALIKIPSTADGAIQNAYFYKSTSNKPRPLIISLHTWSGDYRQRDDLAPLCKQKNLNYIHPNFRGANKTSAACCSELALADIDDAIGYALKYGHVDTSKIYLIGVSGGGYVTLSVFMKSKHHIRKFSAWASITDLEAWYCESVIMKNKYAADILACTESKDSSLDVNNARLRSPMYMRTPTDKLNNAKLFIHVGVFDGIQGSVPITHSLNFYNKLLNDLAVKDPAEYISEHERLQLLEHRRPLGQFGSIGGRRTCLRKQHGNLSLTVFEGEHEMLTRFALDEILEDQ